MIQRLTHLAIFAYTFSSLAFSGIPSLSNLSWISTALLTALWIFSTVAGNAPDASWTRNAFPFLTLFFLLTIMRGPEAFNVFATTLVAWIGALLTAIHIDNDRAIGAMLIGAVGASAANFVAISVGFDAYALYAMNTGDSEQAILQRASGLVGNSNVLAIQAMLTLFITTFWRRVGGKYFIPLAVGCAAHAVIVTGSRKGLILAIAFLPYILLLLHGEPTLRKARQAALGAALAVFLYYTFSATGLLPNESEDVVALKRMEGAFSGEDSSFLERLGLISRGLDMFFENPLLGSGINSFVELSGTGFYSHNNYIELGVSGGIALLAAYYFMHGKVLSKLLFHNSGISHSERRASLLLVVVLLLLDWGMVSYNVKICVLVLCILMSVVNAKRK